MQGTIFHELGQRRDWLQLLEQRYLYSWEQISFFKDTLLAVYRDVNQRIPFILIADNSSAISRDEAIELARREAFEIVVLGDPRSPVVLQLGVYGEYRRLPDIPTWMPRYPRNSLVPRTVTLLPFRTEEDIRKAFKRCHDVVYKELASDPAATFDLLLLVLAAKVLDEQSDDPVYQFGIVSSESAAECKARLLKLLGRAQAWLEEQSGITNVPDVDISENTAKIIFSLLQDYALLLSIDSVAGTDILGTAYETIVGSTFRGELGSYFTPRTIADFMVRFLDIKSGKVFDPACGSGGLLLAALRYARAKKGEGKTLQLFGNDINRRMVKTAKVNFILHGLSPNTVLQGDGLRLDQIVGRLFPGTVIPKEGTWLSVFTEGPFDVIVANPPFAGHEQNNSNLERIESAYRPDGSIRSLNRTIPFLEAIVALLKIGGVAGVVIPVSVLNALEDSFVKLRQVLLKHVELLAIVGLPEWAFTHTGCGVHGCLLFVKRVEKPREDYDVFVDWADAVGYDRLGRESRETDFPRILERYLNPPWPRENTFRLSELLHYDRWDPAWLRIARSLPGWRQGGGEKFIRLSEIVRPRWATVSRRWLDDQRTYRYFEVSDADPDTGEVKQVHEASGAELKKKGRIKILVREGDILLPNHRDSLVAKVGPYGRSVVFVQQHLDGVLTTDRFMVLRSLIDPRVACAILNAAEVRQQIVARSRGAASLDVREDVLDEVLVPKSLVDGASAATLANLVDEIAELRARLLDKIRSLAEMVSAEFKRATSD